ncbi:MAG: type II secretion system protein [Planctomycetes bacterium]|nr:type II secretion system protein [Planctomycetota bacterium]
MIASHSKPSRLVSPGRHRGFSMTELLVVIAIIAVLAGILLVAMRGVRETGLRTQTQSIMQEFSKACDAFQIEHGVYPGVVPETILAQSTTPALSGTENALLNLMGGYRVLSPFDQQGGQVEQDFDDYTGTVVFDEAGWKLKVNVNLMGEGPVINGRPFAPYFTPGAAALGVAKGQAGPPVLGTGSSGLPDLLDAWGQPIIFVRSMRSTGLLAGDVGDTPPPQFSRAVMTPYTESTALGEFGKDQMALSIFNVGSAEEQDATFAQIIRAPAFGKPGEPLNGTARGAYVLISAGPDGIYFSVTDGPGSPSNPVEDIVNDPDFGNPRVVREYDDVRMFGGG